jgi:hypothetical protein
MVLTLVFLIIRRFEMNELLKNLVLWSGVNASTNIFLVLYVILAVIFMTGYRFEQKRDDANGWGWENSPKDTVLTSRYRKLRNFAICIGMITLAFGTYALVRTESIIEDLKEHAEWRTQTVKTNWCAEYKVRAKYVGNTEVTRPREDVYIFLPQDV